MEALGQRAFFLRAFGHEQLEHLAPSRGFVNRVATVNQLAHRQRNRHIVPSGRSSKVTPSAPNRSRISSARVIVVGRTRLGAHLDQQLDQSVEQIPVRLRLT